VTLDNDSNVIKLRPAVTDKKPAQDQ